MTTILSRQTTMLEEVGEIPSRLDEQEYESPCSMCQCCRSHSIQEPYYEGYSNQEIDYLQGLPEMSNQLMHEDSHHLATLEEQEEATTQQFFYQPVIDGLNRQQSDNDLDTLSLTCHEDVCTVSSEEQP